MIKFCPAQVPLSRRLQTGAVCCGALLIFLGHVIGCIAFISLFLSRFWITSVVYACWLLWDKEKPSKGGRRLQWMRGLSIWRYLRDYFPVSLVKTAELDPKKNYILGYHPHGVIGAGAFINFATEGNGFSQIMMSFGICDVSKESILHLCSKKDGGNAIVIVIGGAAESLDAHPGSATLTLKDRKGFVKMAILTGSALVPVYSFGENDLYCQVSNPKGSWLRNFQIKFMKTISFAPLLFHGRGIFQYSFGFLPYRHPVTTVVGAPIPVYKRTNPTMDDIDRIHQKYIERLQMLFDKYKEKYAQDHPNATLTIQ